MKELNSVQMGTAAGAIARLPRPVDFPSGRGCSRLRVEAQIPCKNNTAGPLDFTGAKAKDAIACLFATTSLRFGDKVKDEVDVALGYLRAREMLLELTGDDFFVIGSNNVPVRLNALTDATVLYAAVAAGATITLVVEFARAFEVARLGTDAYRYCPGASQMRQVQFEAIRGGTFDAGGAFVQGAAADLLFLADDFEANDDKWAAVPRLYQNEEAGRVSHGPKAPIGLLAMWEYSQVGAATPLSLFTIGRDGDSPIHSDARASRVVRDALYTDPIGMYDVNGLVTVLHSLPDGSEVNDIPVGSGFIFQQTGAELNPPRTAWLHVPVRTREEIDEFVGRNVANETGIKLISAAAKSPKGITSHAAGMEPMILAKRDDDDFEALPGRVTGIGIAPTDHVPASVMKAAQAAAGAASDPAAARATAGKVTQQLAKALPGYQSGQRHRRGGFFGAMVSRVAGQ